MQLILRPHLIFDPLLYCINILTPPFAPPISPRRKEAHSFLLHALSESCEGLREQLVSYHTHLCLTSLLHDASSQDWTNTKPFFEVC